MARRLTFSVILLAWASLALTPAAGGQAPEPTRPDEPVLHEYIPDADDLKALQQLAKSTGAGKLPQQIPSEEGDLSRPGDTRRPKPGEKPITGLDRWTRRQHRARPDRETTHEGVLHYRAVFNPSVVPFKRVSALGAVDRSFVLTNRDPVFREVPLTPLRPSPDRTMFWGSLLLRARRGQRLPLPSVAPDMQIHGFETMPRGVGMTFAKDGEDNFSVSASRSGLIRLRFLVSAPNRYFSHQVAQQLFLDDIPPGRRPRVPEAVAQVALRMHKRLGLDRKKPLHQLLDGLATHFRAFEEGALAVSSGNTYEDLTVSQRGVCRHRSYAFVITALALGIPARYVTNEAHAFVEVWIPRAGWVRMDLGGAANELNVHSAAKKRVHRPLEDTFAKPPNYSRNYSRLRGNVSGLSSRQRRGPRPRTGHGSSFTTGPSSHGSPFSTDPTRAAPAAAKLPVTLVVAAAYPRQGLRGAPLTVQGRITQGGTSVPLGRRPVEILLRKPGKKTAIYLGEAESDANGRFQLVTTIPVAAQVGTYEVVAYSRPDKTYAPGWSN